MTTRFLFDPPRRTKPKASAGTKSLLIRCPSTAKLTDTGKTVDEKEWPTTQVKPQKLTCSHCGTIHTWTKADVVLGRPLST